MRRESRKRAAQNRVYRKLRREFLESHPCCDWPEGCNRAATDVHHRKGRVGVLLLDVSLWSALCRPHHEVATLNPALAYELGVSVRRVGGAA